MHGQVNATTKEALDHYLQQFVQSVIQVREAVGSEATRKARDSRAKAETALVKAFKNHHQER